MNEHLIYHICTRQAWQFAQEMGYYSADSMATEGFIHASLAEQVAPSANLFFKGQTNLIVLWIDKNRLTANLVFENTTGGTDLFPHIYGTINLAAIEKISDLETDKNGWFYFINT
jgi:uncharacterized protein (DUF952 family)